MKETFHPSSIAIVGATDHEEKIGYIILNNLLELKYSGKIYPINPKHKEIKGLRCFPTVLDIEEKVDLVIIAIPAAGVPKIVEECAWKSEPAQNIVIVSAGFSEAGEEGKKLEAEVVQLAKKHQLNVIGPNCLGIVNPTINLNASFSKNNFKKGNIGLIMQSGAFTTALFDLALGENIGFSLVATLGNKAVSDETKFLEYFAEDENTKVIALYLEDIKNGPLFCETLCKVATEKPVLILKAGNSQKSQSAIMSHTGAMAGEAEVAKEAIASNGGLYFDNLAEFWGAIKLLSGFKPPRGNKVVIVTNAGGPGVVTTDAVESSEALRMIEFTDEEKQELKSNLPSASSVGNPVDVLGDADETRYRDVFDKLKSYEKVGAVLAIVTPQAQTDIVKISQVISQANRESAFPVIPLVIGSESAAVAQQEFAKAKSNSEMETVSNFVYPTFAVKALERYLDFGKISRQKISKSQDIRVNEVRAKENKKIHEQLVKEDRGVCYYPEAALLASSYGLNVLPGNTLTCEKDLKSVDLPFPLVAKIDSPKLIHKNAKGGVALDIMDERALKAVYQDFSLAFKGQRVLVQPQLKAGFEVIMGLKKDPRFGHVLMLGLGGIMTEILNKKTLWILPVSEAEIEEKVLNSIIGKTFQKQKIDPATLVDALEKMVQLANENPWVKELDVNPIIFYSDKAPVIVDVKVLI